VTDFLPIARFAVLLIRPGALVFMAPGLGGMYATSATKIGLTVLLALAVIPVAHMPDDFGDVALTIVIFREVSIGLALAFAVRALIAGAEFAGHLTGHQIGFSYGATIDPQSGVRNNMLAMLYGSLATLAFLAINGHHMLLRAMAASYQGLPIGVGHIDGSILTGVQQMLALVFTVAVRLAAPIVVTLLIVELAVGLISRTAPSLSFMVIGYPIRIVIGLFVLAVFVPTIPAVTTSLLGGAIELSLRVAAAFK
jgi:flagellar biosynthetic protein FliR